LGQYISGVGTNLLGPAETNGTKPIGGTKPISGQNISAGQKLSAGPNYQRTKPIGGTKLSADKTYRRDQTISGQNLSAGPNYQRTKPIGWTIFVSGQNISAGPNYQRTKPIGWTIFVSGQNLSAGPNLSVDKTYRRDQIYRLDQICQRTKPIGWTKLTRPNLISVTNFCFNEFLYVYMVLWRASMSMNELSRNYIIIQYVLNMVSYALIYC
jgi:hypothetical protein